MGMMVDTNVFVSFEKSGKPIDFSAWDSSQSVHISVVIMSELLMRVHRANTQARCPPEDIVGTFLKHYGDVSGATTEKALLKIAITNPK